MKNVGIIIVTGLPGSGKTTLARQVARRYELPLIAKDLIKEPLLDVLGASDAAQSRRLSDASFAVLFSMVRELRRAGAGRLLLEGNFRRGEHEGPLSEALGLAESAPVEVAHAATASGTAGTPATRVRLAQVLCRIPESQRVARLRARANDPVRHRGHRFGECPAAGAGQSHATAADEFLKLPSDRFRYDNSAVHTVLGWLDDWMNLRAASP